MPAIWRPAASRRPACWRKSTTATTRPSRPTSCARSPSARPRESPALGAQGKLQSAASNAHFRGAQGEARRIAPARGAARAYEAACRQARSANMPTASAAPIRQVGRRSTRARQHGALALAAARPRQDLRDGQYPRLHAQGRARPPGAMAHQDRRRQAADADAAAQRGDGQRAGQSVLVRAAVDHPERVAAALRPAIRTFSTAWASR